MIIKRSFLSGLQLMREKVPHFDDYPFCIPAIQRLDHLEFHPKVTFFVGENGSGKSTLLEAMAVKYGFNAEGGNKNLQFATEKTHSSLSDYITLERNDYPKDGFFLRAESFYNVATQMDRIGVSFGKSLHHQSHGEAFLSLLKKLKGNGLYFFDEPEAALSPQRQLSVLTLIHRLMCHNSQLVIATHSPILLAYPGACIYHFSEDGISQINYTDTENYQVTKDFLNRHERMTELLLAEENNDLKAKER